MSEKQEEAAGRLGFVDTLARLFRSKQEAPAPQPEAANRLERLQAEFEAAIRGLDEKIAEHQRVTRPAATGPGSQSMTAEEREARSQERTAAAYRAIREDIVKMHARLGTSLASADLDELVAYLADLDTASAAGKDSHAMLPRARYAIAERLRRESGELAVARLVALLERQKLSWPDPIRYAPSATPAEIEGARRRRLAEVREAFLGNDFKKTADRMLGIVRGWRSDYPDRGSPLWEESVLEGVAAGIRGRLLKEFVELLRRDQELMLSRTEALIGKELTVLQQALQTGATSIEQANRAVASSLRVIDEIVPELAWEHIRAQLPHARGEFDSGHEVTT